MSADEEIQLVTFRVAGQPLAFNVLEVERVLRYEAPTPIPKAPAFLEGMLQYGDELVPLIDLRKRLEVPSEIREETRTIIIETDKGKVGLVVDAVLELLKVPVSSILAPPAIVKGLAAKYVSGIVSRKDKTTIIVSVSKLLSSKEKIALEGLSAGARQ